MIKEVAYDLQYSKPVSISSGAKERLPSEQRLTKNTKPPAYCSDPTVTRVRIHDSIWFHAGGVVRMS